MSITEILTRKQISFYSNFEQGKSYTSCMWTMLDSVLRGGIASWPQAFLGLAPKHLSVHRHLWRKQHALFNILHSWFFKPRTSLAKLIVFMSYYLLMAPKISVCNSWKLLCSTANLVFYKLVYICACYLIMLENISGIFSVISLAQPFYKVKRAEASGVHLSSVTNLDLKTHLPFSRWQCQQQCCLLSGWYERWTSICQPLTKPLKICLVRQGVSPKTCWH